MNGADHRSQMVVGRSAGEAGVAHDVNETGAGVRVRVREAGKVAVDPCCVTRASVTLEGGCWNIKVFG